MFNQATLMGHLGRDPEIRRTQDGRPIANMSVATSEYWTDKATGEKKERTEWHRVVVFNEALCGLVERRLKKGSKVFLQGSIETRKWTDDKDIERYSTEIVLRAFNAQLRVLDAAERAPDPDENSYGKTQTRAATPATDAGKRDDMNDEIPF